MRTCRGLLVSTLLVTAFLGTLPRPCEAASPAFQQAVADSSPVLYYKLDEAAGVAVNYGSFGATYDAAYLGTPMRATTGLSGDGAVFFDSFDDFLESGDVAPGSLTGNPTFTAEAVVMVPAGGSCNLWAPLLHWGPSPVSPSPTARSVYFSFSGNNPTEAYVGFYNGGLQTPSDTMTLGQWHHLIWVRTGGSDVQTGSVLYLDGVDVSSSLVVDPELCCNSETPIVESSAFRMNRAQDFDGSRAFVGFLDEIALYERAFTSAEAVEHYLALTLLFADGFESGGTTTWSAVP